MIRQILEMVKETRRLRNRCKLCSVRTHHRPPLATQWRTTDSALHPFVTDIFTRLPCLFHRSLMFIMWQVAIAVSLVAGVVAGVVAIAFAVAFSRAIAGAGAVAIAFAGAATFAAAFAAAGGFPVAVLVAGAFLFSVAVPISNAPAVPHH